MLPKLKCYNIDDEKEKVNVSQAFANVLHNLLNKCFLVM